MDFDNIEVEPIADIRAALEAQAQYDRDVAAAQDLTHPDARFARFEEAAEDDAEEESGECHYIIHIAKQKAADLPLGVSKQGGLPDLPADLEWPAGLHFLCQLNIDEIKALDWADALPDKGMIWVFVEETGLEGRVLYHPAPTNLAPRPLPAPMKDDPPYDSAFRQARWTYSPSFYVEFQDGSDRQSALQEAVGEPLVCVGEQSDRLFGSPVDFQSMGSGILFLREP